MASKEEKAMMKCVEMKQAVLINYINDSTCQLYKINAPKPDIGLPVHLWEEHIELFERDPETGKFKISNPERAVAIWKPYYVNIFDISLGLTSPVEGLDMRVWGKNLTNQDSNVDPTQRTDGTEHADTDERARALLGELCEKLLANPVIEDHRVVSLEA